MNGNLAFAARHSMDSPEWYTPSVFVEAARDVMGGIDLDPASHEEANLTVKAARFFTEDDDGLIQNWSGRVFINPPGGLVKEFWTRLVSHYGDSAIEQAIWIGYSLEQLQTLQSTDAQTPLHFPLCVPNRRIAFVENEAKQAERRVKLEQSGKKFSSKSSPSHANYITYMGHRKQAFADVFSRFGQVVLR